MSKISLKTCSSSSCEFSACGFPVQTFRSYLPCRKYTGERSPYRRASYLGEQWTCYPPNSQDTLITRAFEAEALCVLAPRHPDSCQEGMLPGLRASPPSFVSISSNIPEEKKISFLFRILQSYLDWFYKTLGMQVCFSSTFTYSEYKPFI